MSLQTSPIILVLGGYGNFGKRICATLAKEASLQIVIAGRNINKAKELANRIQHEIPQSNIQPFLLDWQAANFKERLKESHADIVIHAAGPFQDQTYKVAETCIDLKIHYLDLADGRNFVTHIKQLNEKAVENGVVVISGASSVPGLSSVVVDTYAPEFAILREVDFGIAPGNKAERGNATIAGALTYSGKPFQRLEFGEWKTVYGWQNLHQYYYGDNLGMRWHANCDVPDLTLLPERYPTLKTVVFYAGLEVSILHYLMWNMSWLARLKLIKNLSLFHKPITAVSNWFNHLGTDAGGMYLRMYGTNLRYQPLEVKWTLVAEKGDGPYIPIIPSVILVKKIIQGMIPPGAQPCLGMFTLADFDQIAGSWHIYHTVEETVT